MFLDIYNMVKLTRIHEYCKSVIQFIIYMYVYIFVYAATGREPSEDFFIAPDPRTHLFSPRVLNNPLLLITLECEGTSPWLGRNSGFTYLTDLSPNLTAPLISGELWFLHFGKSTNFQDLNFKTPILSTFSSLLVRSILLEWHKSTLNVSISACL